MALSALQRWAVRRSFARAERHLERKATEIRGQVEPNRAVQPPVRPAGDAADPYRWLRYLPAQELHETTTAILAEHHRRSAQRRRSADLR